MVRREDTAVAAAKKKRQRTKALPPQKPDLFEEVLASVLLGVTLLSPYYRGLYFRLERYPFFLVICAAGIAFGVFRALRRRPITVPPFPILPLALFVLLYACNVFFSAHHGLAHQEFTNWGVYVLFLVVFLLADIPCASGTILLLFGANSAILTILGLAQAFRGMFPNRVFLGMSFFEMFVGGRLHSTFQYPNTASAYFGIGLFALFGVTLLPEEKPWKRDLALFLAFLVLGGLFFTYSRGGLLVTALTLLLFLFLLPQNARAKLFANLVATVPVFFALTPLLERFLASGKPLPFFGLLGAGGVFALALRNILSPLETWVASLGKRKFALFTGTLLGVLLGVLVAATRLGLLGRQAGRFLEVSLRSRSVWERLVFYRDGLRLFLGRPVNGWGGGGWEALYFSVRSFPYFTKSTHNFYLQLLIEGGLLGIILFGVFLFFLFRSLAARLRDSSPLPGILLSLLALAFLHGFVDVDFNLGAYQLTVWLFVALALKTSLPQGKVSSFRLPHFLFTGVCAVFLVLSILYVGAEGQRTFGEYAAERGDWRSAVAAYENALRFTPWDPDLHRALSTALREGFLKTRESALRKRSTEEGEKALRLAPKSASILEHLGVLYAEQGAFDRAFQLLNRAIEENPFEPHIYLNAAKVAKAVGEYFLEKGDREKAIEYLQKGLEIGDRLERDASRSLEPPRWDTRAITETLEEIRKLLQHAGA